MKPSAYLAAIARHVLCRAQGGICHICGQPLDLRGGVFGEFTVDHIWPKRIDARLDKMFGNGLLAHRACNERKGSRAPTACEVLMLFAVNRQLGLRESATAHWDSAEAFPRWFGNPLNYLRKRERFHA